MIQDLHHIHVVVIADEDVFVVDMVHVVVVLLFI
jgi:hypothetical protein